MVNETQQLQQKRSGWSLWHFIVLAALVLLALFGERGLIASYKTGLYQSELERKVEELRASNAELRKEIQALRTDRNYLETLARRERGMIRDDEIVYQFVGDETSKK